jgi:D-amino-acid dehydrogenase
MKVLVIGGGVIGVTSAYYLRRAGHDVTLIDRQPAIATETSFANGGQVSWSSASPWAAPGIPLTALGWLVKPHSPLILRPNADPAMWRWLFGFLRNCTTARYRRNKARQIRLARFSYRQLTDLARAESLSFDAQMRGTLILYRTRKAFAHARRDRAVWDSFGLRVRELGADQCIEHEPGLADSRDRIAGGLLFDDDACGDCRAFTEALAGVCRSRGVTIELGTTVERIVRTGARVDHVATSAGPRRADAYVLAAGSYTPLLLRPLRIDLPVFPVKGYSITLPVGDPSRAPRGTVTDEKYKVVITRLGDRVRAAGTAELSGYNLTLRGAPRATITRVVSDLFPHCGDLNQVEFWTGLRPMTPDNPPVIGATPLENLFLNTGHGTLGWTMACGSGAVLADIVSGEPPDIDMDGLTLERFP